MKIETSKGMLDEALLVKQENRRQGPTGVVEAQEWRLGGELVKRSVTYHAGKRLINGEIVE